MSVFSSLSLSFIHNGEYGRTRLSGDIQEGAPTPHLIYMRLKMTSVESNLRPTLAVFAPEPIFDRCSVQFAFRAYCYFARSSRIANLFLGVVYLLSFILNFATEHVCKYPRSSLGKTPHCSRHSVQTLVVGLRPSNMGQNIYAMRRRS